MTNNYNFMGSVVKHFKSNTLSLIGDTINNISGVYHYISITFELLIVIDTHKLVTSDRIILTLK